MSKPPPETKTVRSRALHHAQLALTGLAVVFLPIVIVSKAVEQAHKAVAGIMKKVAPGIELLGGIGITILVLVLLLLACWLLGWIVSRTEFGRRLLAWERKTFLGKAPKLQKEIETREKAGEPKPKDPLPALALVGGAWQPAEIVDEHSDGWVTVLLPDLGSTEAGRIYLLSREQVRRLDVPLDDFRKKLKARGRDTQDWLRALSEDAQATPGNGS